MKYTHIVFDIDGTLLDTAYALIHSLQDTVRELTGQEIAGKDLNFVLELTGQGVFEHLNLGENISEKLHKWTENMDHYMDKVKVFPGMEQVLKFIADSGGTAGIVTAKNRDEFNHDFCRFEIVRYFKS